ncbi:MAG: FecR domain-containing protein [Bacteroidetes bacterium]|nr:FecR domain-containing protein [Bacteroidota bacterium]
MDFQQARTFLEKFAAGRHTEGEHEDFIAWLQTAPMTDVQTLSDEYAAIAGSRQQEPTTRSLLAHGIEAAIDQYEANRQPVVEAAVPVVEIRRPWRRYTAAAAIVLLLATGSIVYWATRHTSKSSEPGSRQIASANVQDLAPGSNKALLVLSNGSTIVLDSAANGTIAKQANTLVNKKGAELQYEDASQAGDHSIVYNTVSTPRGGQYQVTLPDGTKVWLNAASSLRFPTAFSGNERSVELSGEAYFEVAQNPAKPFKVRKKDSNIEVQVLGTHFNVNAYDDEGDTKITLLEGKISITAGQRPTTLFPGQQALVLAATGKSSDIIVRTNADLDEAMAWKNGLFQFNNTNIAAMMKQLSRWYDVDIAYEGNVMNESFSGTIPRNTTALGLFEVLELTKTVQFSIEHKKIVVRPYKK